MKNRDDLARGWWRKAMSDLIALEASRKAGALDAACFHAQQAAEKTLKSFLAYSKKDFPYTHNLVKLVNLCAEEDPDFLGLIPAVESLTPFAVELRYDAEFWPSEDTADNALANAKEVQNFIAEKLPSSITQNMP